MSEVSYKVCVTYMKSGKYHDIEIPHQPSTEHALLNVLKLMIDGQVKDVENISFIKEDTDQ